MKGLALALIAAAMTFSACGSEKNEEAEERDASPSSPRSPAATKPKTSPESPSTAADRTRAIAPATPALDCGVAGGGEAGAGAQLVDVRVGTHGTFDRVTFEFAPTAALMRFGIPSFRIHSVSAPTEDPSGQPISLQGNRYAEIVFQNASGVDTTEPDYTVTYDGPEDFTPRFEVLQEAKAAGDFERVLSWAFGLSGGGCWRILELEDPARVVVDFPA